MLCLGRYRLALLTFAALAVLHPAASPALLSKSEERTVGRRVVEEVRRQFRVLEDPYLATYLSGMGRRLAAASGAPAAEFDFFVVADSRINAFAVPGGHIFVTSQAILSAGDESELAGVVAHEMGHVEARHIAYRLEAATKANLAALAAVIAGAFLARSPQAGAAVATFGVAAAQTKMLQYSRGDEEDADRRAVRTLVAAGYDPWGLVRFMETIRKQSPAPEGVPAYLFTHPLPENRSIYLAQMLTAPPPRAAGDEAPGLLWRIQARVLAEDPRPWGLELAKSRATVNPGSADAQLGMALVLRSQGRFGDALAAADAAVDLAPGDHEIAHERAAVLLRLGRQTEAIAALERLRDEGSATPQALQELGWAYLEADRGEEALAAYEELDRRNPDGLRWERLDYFRGLALGKAGREGEGRAALGDYYRQTGDGAEALKNYREALKFLKEGPLKERVEQAAGELAKEHKGE